jgi:predicted MPP superfamily phosphohydrolase
MPYRAAWLTDIHFDLLTPSQIDEYLAQLDALRVNSLFITGDIGGAGSVAAYLRRIENTLRVPIYFVLGNHDYYGGSVEAVRAEIKALCASSRYLRYLSQETYIELMPSVALVGHDGWADLRIGNFARSSVWMRDYEEIHDLRGRKKADLPPVMEALAGGAADHLAAVLPDVLARYSKVIVLTHYPPFREAFWHQGAISDEDWLPHFTSHAVGEALRAAMNAQPDRQMVVLCGHSHSSGEARILPNLHVLTGEAEYGLTRVQQIITLEA